MSKIIDNGELIMENRQSATERSRSMPDGDGLSLPKSWEVKKLGEIFDVRDGTHDSPKYIEKGYPLITSKNLKKGIITHISV